MDRSIYIIVGSGAASYLKLNEQKAMKLNVCIVVLVALLIVSCDKLVIDRRQRVHLRLYSRKWSELLRSVDGMRQLWPETHFS